MTNYMRYTKALVAILVILPILSIASVAHAAPWDFLFNYRNSADSDTVSGVNTPPAVENDIYYLWGFRGVNDTGEYRFFNLGSGFGKSGTNLSVTPTSIETPEGNLQNTLNSKVSTSTMASAIASAIASAVSGLSGGSFTQVQADYATTSTSSPAYIKNKLDIVAMLASATSSMATVAQMNSSIASATSSLAYDKSYEGTTLRTRSFPIFKNATVASGVAVFHLTADGTSGGTTLCTNGIVQDSIDVEVNDATASFQMSYALSNGNKTITVTANKLTTSNILTGILGQAQANGSVIRLVAWCY